MVVNINWSKTKGFPKLLSYVTHDKVSSRINIFNTSLVWGSMIQTRTRCLSSVQQPSGLRLHNNKLLFSGNSNNGGFAMDDILLKTSEESACTTRPAYRTTIQNKFKIFHSEDQKQQQHQSLKYPTFQLFAASGREGKAIQDESQIAWVTNIVKF